LIAVSAIEDLPHLIAQTTHGPGRHGPALVGLVLVVVVVGLVYLVWSRTGRMRSERERESDRALDSERDRDSDT